MTVRALVSRWVDGIKVLCVLWVVPFIGLISIEGTVSKWVSIASIGLVRLMGLSCYVILIAFLSCLWTGFVVGQPLLGLILSLLFVVALPVWIGFTLLLVNLSADDAWADIIRLYQSRNQSHE